MHTQRVVSEMDADAVGVHQAGQRVPPGTYRPLEGGREVRLEQEDVLPVTLDGHVAVSFHCPETWGERLSRIAFAPVLVEKGHTKMSDQATPEAAPAADDLGAALMLHENGRFPDAVLCYRRALSREPENTLGRYLLGLALMASGDTNGARAEWEAVSRCSATEGQAAWALGRAQALLERVDVPSARQD